MKSPHFARKAALAVLIDEAMSKPSPPVTLDADYRLIAPPRSYKPSLGRRLGCYFVAADSRMPPGPQRWTAARSFKASMRISVWATVGLFLALWPAADLAYQLTRWLGRS